ncbi:MAG: hypothetical protein Q9165_000494 [Trypethelium subeluteriae]
MEKQQRISFHPAKEKAKANDRAAALEFLGHTADARWLKCYKRSREPQCKYTEKGLRYLSASQKKGALKEKMERLETFVCRLQETLPSPEGLATASAPEDLGDNSVSQEVASQMGKLRLYESGSTRWVGPSHWEFILDDIADVKAYLELETDLDTSECDQDSEWNIQEVDVLLGTPRILSLQDLLNLLPPKVEMDRFVAAWFNIMEPTRGKSGSVRYDIAAIF